MRERGLIRSIALRCLQLLPVVLLLAANVLGETRNAVAAPIPEYPEIARRMNITGVVKVEIVVGADGNIKSAKVLGGHPLLADAVQQALKRWKYAPGAAETTIQMDFKF